MHFTLVVAVVYAAVNISKSPDCDRLSSRLTLACVSDLNSQPAFKPQAHNLILTTPDISPAVADTLARETAASVLPPAIDRCPPDLQARLERDFDKLMERPVCRSDEEVCIIHSEIQRIQELTAGY